MKITIQGVGCLPASYLLKNASEIPQTTQAIATALTTIMWQDLMLKIAHAGWKDIEISTETKQENLFLLASFHSTGKYDVTAGEKRHQWSYPVSDPACCSVDLPGETCPLTQ